MTDEQVLRCYPEPRPKRAIITSKSDQQFTQSLTCRQILKTMNAKKTYQKILFGICPGKEQKHIINSLQNHFVKNNSASTIKSRNPKDLI